MLLLWEIKDGLYRLETERRKWGHGLIVFVRQQILGAESANQAIWNKFLDWAGVLTSNFGSVMVKSKVSTPSLVRLRKLHPITAFLSHCI